MAISLEQSIKRHFSVSVQFVSATHYYSLQNGNIILLLRRYRRHVHVGLDDLNVVTRVLLRVDWRTSAVPGLRLWSSR